MSRKVFISHSTTDTWVATQMANHIESTGASTFLDDKDIAVGEKFPNTLKAELNSADELVALLTPWAVKSKFVWMEIGVAWGREIPIAGLLHGITLEKVLEHEQHRLLLGGTNLQPLNSFPRYVKELSTRIEKREAA